MPGRDQTGPMGQGAMTGGGFGFCNSEKGWDAGRGTGTGAGRGTGRGVGMGRRAGRGRGAGCGAGMGRGTGKGSGPGMERTQGFNAPPYEGEMNIQPVGNPVYLDEKQKKRLTGNEQISNADIAEQLTRLNNRIDSLENEIKKQ